MINSILNFNGFLSINESKKTNTKKDLGVIGPNSEGSFQILVGENRNFNFSEDADSFIITSGEKSIKLPKKSCEITKEGNLNILKTLPYTSWFREDENMETFEDFIFNSIEQNFSSQSEDYVLDNLEVLLDEMGLDLYIRNIEKKGENFYDVLFSNGMECECRTESEHGFIKNIRIYKEDCISDPLIKINLLNKEPSVFFSSERGKFKETVENFSDLVKNPIFKYLSCFLIGKNKQEHDDYMVDYYKRLMKYHNWKETANNESKEDRHKAERKEIERIREILRHTHDDEELEKLFIEARESYLSTNQNS